MIFETRRLLVRCLQQSDFPAFHEMQSDDEVMKYTASDGSIGRGLDEQQNRFQLDDCIKRYDHAGNRFWVWAIVEKQSNDFVGTCAIVENEQNEMEIGYRILRKHWRKGMGVESAEGLITFAIGGMKLNSFVAYVDLRNLASVKILQRSQMRLTERIESNGQTDLKFIWP
ncbi:MAG: GNAT family N-acetyltransferase [Planctomycetota bacterium]